jgi:hypothetical protein
MPRSARFQARSSLLFGLLCALLVGCTEEKAPVASTQVTLRVQPYGAELSAVLTEIRFSLFRQVEDGLGAGQSGPGRCTECALAAGRADPAVFAGAEQRQFEVIVDGYVGDTRSAQARVVSSFASGSLRLLELWLYSCGGQLCAADECHGALCTSCGALGTCDAVVVLDARTLPVYDPSRAPEAVALEDAGGSSEPVSTLDSGRRLDASLPDVGTGLRDPGLPDAAPAAVVDAAPAPTADSGSVAVSDSGSPPEPLPCNGACPSSKPVCEPSTQTCVECTSGAQCPSQKPYCDQQVCVACAGEMHCSGSARYCVDHRCVGCRSPSDCPMATPRCIDGACAPACTSSADCSQSGAQCEPTTMACVCVSAGVTCSGGSLRALDSCGQTGAVTNSCCGRGCSGTTCTAPDPRASVACHQGDRYYLDSCGTPGERVQSCCGRGCSAGTCAPPDPKATLTCFNGDSYYVDSCGARGALAKSCCGLGCSGAGVCAAVNPQASRTCTQGQAYWVDGCGALGAQIEDCGGRGCVSGACRTCPAGMASLGNTAVCIDRYEASLWSSASCSGTRYNTPPAGFPAAVSSQGFSGSVTIGHETVTLTAPTTNVYACSVSVPCSPVGGLSFYQAKRALRRLGQAPVHRQRSGSTGLARGGGAGAPVLASLPVPARATARQDPR